MSERRVLKWATLLDTARAQLPLWFLLGHVSVETGGNERHESSLHEAGLFEIHPDTLKELAPNLDPGARQEAAKVPTIALQWAIRMYNGYRRHVSDWIETVSGDEEYIAMYLIFAVGRAGLGVGLHHQKVRTVWDALTILSDWPEYSRYHKAAKNAALLYRSGKDLERRYRQWGPS